jgi:hypothetical protein
MFSFTANGQLVSALIVLVDAIFGVLVALGIVHVKPDQTVIALVVTALFNFAGYVWAYIQHTQHVTALRLGLIRNYPLGAEGRAPSNPPSTQTRRG